MSCFSDYFSRVLSIILSEESRTPCEPEARYWHCVYRQLPYNPHSLEFTYEPRTGKELRSRHAESIHMGTIKTNATEAEIEQGVWDIIRVRQEIAKANAPDQELSKEELNKAVSITVKQVKEIITKLN